MIVDPYILATTMIVTLGMYVITLQLMSLSFVSNSKAVSIRLARVVAVSCYAMLVLNLYSLQYTVPSSQIDNGTPMRHAITRSLIAVLYIALGIWVFPSLRRNRCPKCGKRSLQSIYPGLGKYRYICSQCDYCILSRRYLNEHPDERPQESSTNSSEIGDTHACQP